MSNISHETQKSWWTNEWSNADQDLKMPGQSDIEPSDSVRELTDLAIDQFKDSSSCLRVLDVGCGIGRNALYLATKFDEVVGVDYADTAVSRSQSINTTGLNCTFVQADATQLPFADSSFDIILDSLTSTSMQKAARNKFADEAYRLLRPKGLLLMRCVSASDDTESNLMRTNPGPEVNSSIWPDSLKFQKNFSAQEVIEMHDRLSLLLLKRVQKFSQKLGSHVYVTNWSAIFEKLEEGN